MGFILHLCLVVILLQIIMTLYDDNCPSLLVSQVVHKVGWVGMRAWTQKADTLLMWQLGYYKSWIRCQWNRCSDVTTSPRRVDEVMDAEHYLVGPINWTCWYFLFLFWLCRHQTHYLTCLQGSQGLENAKTWKWLFNPGKPSVVQSWNLLSLLSCKVRYIYILQGIQKAVVEILSHGGSN